MDCADDAPTLGRRARHRPPIHTPLLEHLHTHWDPIQHERANGSEEHGRTQPSQEDDADPDGIRWKSTTGLSRRASRGPQRLPPDHGKQLTTGVTCSGWRH